MADVHKEPHEDEREPRVRTLTDRGQVMFEEHFMKLQDRFRLSWQKMEDIMAGFDNSSTDRKYLRQIENEVNEAHKQFLLSSQQLMTFLGNAHTKQASERMDLHVTQYRRYSDIAYKFRDSVQNMSLEAAEQLSEKLETRSNAPSSRSSASSTLLQKRMKAEAQQIRLKFLEEQAALEKQKAALENQKTVADIDLQLLRERETAAVANIEANIMESYESGLPVHVKEEVDMQLKRERTEAYVRSQTDAGNSAPVSEVRNSPPYHSPQPPMGVSSVDPVGNQVEASSHTAQQVRQSSDLQQSALHEMSNFLLKKDLLMHRFSAFDDKPENYTAWKVGFISIVRELKTSPVEELDLLTRWLGPESKKYALSIRAANVCQPERGLALIWDRLEDRYGKPEMVEAALKAKLSNFPKITDSDPKRLYDLLDLLYEIDSNKQDGRYSGLLGYFDSSSGVLPIVGKLTDQIQNKWASRASQYKRTYNVPFPPFTFFVQFIQEMCDLKNDPGLMCNQNRFPIERRRGPPRISVHKTNVDVETTPPPARCPIHRADHSLEKCRTFLRMTFKEKRELLKSRGVCYRCCKGKHHANRCESKVKCDNCGSFRHVTCMHFDRDYGGETAPKQSLPETQEEPQVFARCTQLCGSSSGGRSCGKIVLVNVYPEKKPEQAIRTYALVDDQSNRTLARSKLFDIFSADHKVKDCCVYTLSSCSGSLTFSGRSAEGFIVEPVSGGTQLHLPRIIECDEIPNNRQEIPTPDVASAYHHLSDIASLIPELDPSADILLLIGRDLPSAHHVLKQRTGPANLPFAQELYLGWTIIGEVCLTGAHRPKSIAVNKTHVLYNGRGSILEPCGAQMCVTEECVLHPRKNTSMDVSSGNNCSIFAVTTDDEKPGLSTEDREFIDLMSKEFHKDTNGKWTAPLPFRTGRPTLPNNHAQALQRALILDKSFHRNPVKRDHAVEFMQNILERGHAEPAPPLKPQEECWYLPIFGVYHPLKPNKIRMVFDSSARFQDISLNAVLLSGPDLTNSLIGVLMRFRMERVAVTADIEQMFHCFAVSEKHRNFLRFLWYTDNDPSKPLTDYRMCVHVFGNTPSPAVATYGLRRAASEAEPTFGKDVHDFVERNFYVDDALMSSPTAQEAADLLHRTKQALATHWNLRLHKIASNEPTVLESFSAQDLAKDLIDLDFSQEDLPTQRSLGLVWDLQNDAFGFRIALEEKPYTRRGVLSCVNSLYDPLGFIAPVTIQGKLLLREMTQTPCTDWDSPLPDEYLSRWLNWIRSLSILQELKVPRVYLPAGFSKLRQKQALVFTDASEVAIAAVAYLYDDNPDRHNPLGFIMGKAKVAPRPATSVPRLELCAAVLGVEIATIICDQLDIGADNFKFFTDSKIVLGYIHNRTRRFLTYVSNRVQRILSFSPSSQWNFIPTDQNPADHGTKPTTDKAVYDPWLCGPLEWLRTNGLKSDQAPTFDLVDPSLDQEIKQDIMVNKVDISEPSLGTVRFERFSSWRNLICAIALLKNVAHRVKNNHDDDSKEKESLQGIISAHKRAEEFIIKQVQLEVFHRDISAIWGARPLTRDSRIARLDPVLDERGVVRVGGRLRQSGFDLGERSPILIPGEHYIARLLVLHYHKLTQHQGRHFTEGAIRSAGLWITGAKRLVSSIIFKCVKCRRGRGSLLTQKMADLPQERLKSSPPFTYVGVDCFGPWEIITRRTRGGSANSKRWAVIFTCMCSRAVHIEVLEQMSTPSFINALRRFYALCGPVKEFFSDRGTNFVGCVREQGISAINVEDPPVQSLLVDRGTIWKFNTSYSSHMGGAWERLIGVTRRILDALLLEEKHTRLTHEVLTTFFAEVSAIINNRPIVPVSSDPDSPFVLTPNILLTQKTGDVSESPLNLEVRDFYTSQWKTVQVLANRFWERWRQQYLQSLQSRRKWTEVKPNIQVGDVVLLKDSEQHRNYWPLSRVTRVFPSKDDLVRKVEVVTFSDGTKHTYVRPITQIVPLLSTD